VRIFLLHHQKQKKKKGKKSEEKDETTPRCFLFALAFYDISRENLYNNHKSGRA